MHSPSLFLNVWLVDQFLQLDPAEYCETTVYLNFSCLIMSVFLLPAALASSARATLEILIPDFVKQTSEEKPVEGDELEVLFLDI